MKLEDIALDAKMDQAMREKMLKEAHELMQELEKAQQKKPEPPERRAV